MKTKKIIFILLALFFASANLYSQNDSYLIQRGDILDIVVMEHPEFSIAAIVVMPDGFIQYPGFGSVQVAGLTAKQLTDSLEKALDKFIVYPIVSIFIRRIQNERVNVYGYVNNQGQVQLFQEKDILTVISMAGGLKSVKKAKRVTIIRANRTVVHLNIRDLLREASKNQKTLIPMVYVGDTVIVEEPKEFNWSRMSFIATLLTSAVTITSIIISNN